MKGQDLTRQLYLIQKINEFNEKGNLVYMEKTLKFSGRHRTVRHRTQSSITAQQEEADDDNNQTNHTDKQEN